MPKLNDIPVALGRVSIAAVLLGAMSAGCATIASTPDVVGAAGTESRVAGTEAAGTEEVRTAARSGDASSRAAPARREAVPSAPRREVLVLFSGVQPGAERVAAGIAARLPGEHYRVRHADVAAPGAAETIAAMSGAPGLTGVAVGLDAFELARQHLADRPLVFCQVFNYQALLDPGRPVWGVSPMPPLALQLRGWKGAHASLARIGLIVSEAHEHLVEEAARAAQASRVDLTSVVSSSDRETLYLFKRLAPELDGLWLFPDNRILSPAVLQELLSYALSHGVGVLVPNETLLPWGALLSATSRTEDVATAVAAVVERVASGTTGGLPVMTSLAEAAFELNPAAADRLGLAVGPETSWVLREPD